MIRQRNCHKFIRKTLGTILLKYSVKNKTFFNVYIFLIVTLTNRENPVGLTLKESTVVIYHRDNSILANERHYFSCPLGLKNVNECFDTFLYCFLRFQTVLRFVP